MKLVRPAFTIQHFPVNPAVRIERAGRNCYKSEDRITADSAEEFVRMLKGRTHSAMLEFGGMPQIFFRVDRGVTHELVRHRLCSFAQESTRYCNYGKGKFGSEVTYIIPPWITLEEGHYHCDSRVGARMVFKRGREELSLPEMALDDRNWLMAMQEAEWAYFALLNDCEQSPQQARAALPQATKADIVVSANTREWIHIFRQRTGKAAHPQMREVMAPLAREFARRCPSLYDEFAEVEDPEGSSLINCRTCEGRGEVDRKALVVGCPPPCPKCGVCHSGECCAPRQEMPVSDRLATIAEFEDQSKRGVKTCPDCSGRGRT